jgi:hypothetical protein
LPWGNVEEFADRVLRAAVVGEMMSGAIDPEASPHESVLMLKEMLDEQHRG